VSHLGIGGRCALDIRAGQVVEQKLVLHAEELAVARGQVTLEADLVWQQQIQAAIQAIGVHPGGGDAEDIVQRRRGVPAGLDRQLAPGRTQSVDRQHRRDPRPGHLRRHAVQRGLTEAIQPQALPDVPAEPHVAEVSGSGPADPIEPDLHHRRVHQVRCGAGWEQRELLLLAVGLEDANRLAPAGLGRAVQFPEIADRALAWSVRGANCLNERPVEVVLSVLAAPIRSHKHVGSTPRSHTRARTAKREGLHYIVPRAPVLNTDRYFHVEAARLLSSGLGLVRNLG
jgi:hypothetical protein